MQMVSVVVYHITYNHCSLKKFFFSVAMKMIIISERNNCMTKASSVTDSYLQNFNHNFFFVKVDIHESFLSLLMITRKGHLMFVIFCTII